jgi:putative ATP-grasp target RiPP
MKTNKTRTQIDDISVTGRELNEAHLRFVAGGALATRRSTYAPTASKGGWVRDVTDVYTDSWSF